MLCNETCHIISSSLINISNHLTLHIGSFNPACAALTFGHSYGSDPTNGKAPPPRLPHKSSPGFLVGLLGWMWVSLILSSLTKSNLLHLTDQASGSGCGSGGGAGHLLIRRSVVRSLTPVCMLKCPWERYWSPSCSQWLFHWCVKGWTDANLCAL